uniref:Acyloxyacyl hydrolase n=1 Tax=Timema tahoe TaxID=61484 RepID=A0A7R9NZJ0_9NEOP|nr:unnamed protein product [Timema tahoe]
MFSLMLDLATTVSHVLTDARPCHNSLTCSHGCSTLPQQSHMFSRMLDLATTVSHGYTDSIYWKLRSRNRCNHRDYQNLSQNGASSGDLLRYLKTVSRNLTTDNPALVFYGMFGNDVCNRFANTTSNMTTPETFRKNVVQVLESLEAILPAGSHVVLIGLVDGGLIYPIMADRLHPIGQVGNNVYYHDVYNWFNCMEIGPCVGWMNSNATLRKITSRDTEFHRNSVDMKILLLDKIMAYDNIIHNVTMLLPALVGRWAECLAQQVWFASDEAAQRLSSVLQDIVGKEKFQSFDLNYLDNPFHEVIYRWQQQGSPAWELIDPVDSLHPAQDAQPLIASILWEHINEKFPHVLGDINPNNDKIQQVFGDQQGH